MSPLNMAASMESGCLVSVARVVWNSLRWGGLTVYHGQSSEAAPQAGGNIRRGLAANGSSGAPAPHVERDQLVRADHGALHVRTVLCRSDHEQVKVPLRCVSPNRREGLSSAANQRCTAARWQVTEISCGNFYSIVMSSCRVPPPAAAVARCHSGILAIRTFDWFRSRLVGGAGSVRLRIASVQVFAQGLATKLCQADQSSERCHAANLGWHSRLSCCSTSE